MSSPEDQRKSPTPPQAPRFRFSTRWIVFAAALLIFNFFLASRAMQPTSRVSVPYSPFFLQQVRDGHVKEITSKGTAVQGTFTQNVTYDGEKPTTNFRTEIPAFADNDALSQLLQSKGVIVNAEPLDTGPPWWQSLLLGFGPTLLFLLLLVWLMRRAGNVQGLLGSFGRSRARRYQPTGDKVTFADVAGIDEAKAELSEVVDFLRMPDKYRRLGARIPRGVLLSGPPGTGRRCSRAQSQGRRTSRSSRCRRPSSSRRSSGWARRASAISSSRRRQPRRRSSSSTSSMRSAGRVRPASRGSAAATTSASEKTLNQILTEMDGFGSSTNVIVIGATNRPDVLDSALLRPGRFDRRVAVQPPDRAGREAILEVHARSVPLAPEVDLGRIAATTPGMVGADLANLVNEAALLAARRNHQAVAESDFTDALERIVLGAERRVMMTEEDRRRTAYHEGGHAIVGMLTPGADPVRKVSIIPRGLALGVTFAAPESDRFNYRAPEVVAKIKVALGGRAAEEVVYSDTSTGAESDIQQLTQIARQMVGRWGMSSAIGPIAVLPRDGAGPLLPGVAEVSPHTQELIDDEVRRIVDESHREVVSLLTEHRSKLDSLANALLEHETLDEEDAYAAAGVPRAPTSGADSYAAAARSRIDR